MISLFPAYMWKCPHPCAICVWSINKYYLQRVTNVKHNVSSQRNVSGENWISVKSSTWWCPDSLVTLSSCCADLVFALRSYGNPDVTVWRGSWRNVWWEATEYGHQLWETAASNAVLPESNRTTEILRLLVAWMHRSRMLLIAAHDEPFEKSWIY